MFVQTIALRDAKFYAYHGFYPEEQLIGNHFLVMMILLKLECMKSSMKL